MKSRPKDLGTRFETWIVNRAQDAGLIAERIAEGGAYDLGDIRVYADDDLWILEAKYRSNLPIHQAVAKAQLKAGTTRAAVVWKRLVRQNGNQRRTSAGPVIVAITLDTFLELLVPPKGET